MANYNRKPIYDVEDYAGVTTGDVIGDGYVRWFDNVTGFDAAEVVQLIGDGSSSIATLLAAKIANTVPGDKTVTGDITFTGGVTGLPLPAGFIYGLETSSAADADHDVTIATGKCRDYADSVDIELSSATTKRIDATWAAGSGNGGLFTGAVAADTTYHMFVIKKDSDGSIDAGWDTDIDCANIPTGYTEYRRIASFVTDSSSNIFGFNQNGNMFTLTDPETDYSATSPGTSRVTVALTVPSGLVVSARVSVSITNSASGNYLVTPLSVTDSAPTATWNTLRTDTASIMANTDSVIDTDTSSQIAFRSTDGVLSGGARITTNGWIDYRGQFGDK